MKEKYYNLNMKIVDGIYTNLIFDSIVKLNSMLFFHKNEELVFSCHVDFVKHKLRIARIRDDLESIVFKDYTLDLISQD